MATKTGNFPHTADVSIFFLRYMTGGGGNVVDLEAASNKSGQFSDRWRAEGESQQQCAMQREEKYGPTPPVAQFLFLGIYCIHFFWARPVWLFFASVLLLYL